MKRIYSLILAIVFCCCLIFVVVFFLPIGGDTAGRRGENSTGLSLPAPTPATPLEYYAMGNRQTVAKSVVLLVHKNQVPTNSPPTTQTFGQTLCAVNCANQPAVMGISCTGVLVAPDVVATAGHCVNQFGSATNIRVIFGYRYNNLVSAGQGTKPVITAANIYEGKEIIGIYHHRCMRGQNHLDWGLIRLKLKSGETAVTGIQPATISPTLITQSNVNDPVYVLGYPMGLPLKLSDQGKVKNVQANYFDSTTVCVAGQSSGSPVFNNSNNIVGLVSEVLGDMEPRIVKTSQFALCLTPNSSACQNYKGCLANLRKQDKKCKPSGPEPCSCQ